MGENSKISWTDNTWNPWWGCTEVGPGCDNCYARGLANRYGYGWGHGVPRRYFADKHWNEPRRWNRRAREAGKRVKVFCSSMADIFDNEVEQVHRERLWELIAECNSLNWLLLTKRIGNAGKMLPRRWIRDGIPTNAWLGITVVDQEEADRDIPKLLDFYGLLWLSIEPQLAPIALRGAQLGDSGETPGYEPSINWVVCGGESGSENRVRPFHAEWARDLKEQCRIAKVPFFMKQMGALTFMEPKDGDPLLRRMNHADAANPMKWPKDLRIQEFPI